MTVETLLRLALVPTAVWLASLAARRWGHSVSGYLGGMPLIGGPITLFLALDFGAEFAARSALFTLAAVAAQAAHLTAFAFAGRRHGWAVALASGWSAFALVSVAIARTEPALAIAALLAALGLLAAARAIPVARSATTLPAIPALELRLRLAAALALAAFILWSAPVFGPAVSGVLLSLPITGSIMPPFTLALYGADALLRLVRGFLVGLTGFSTFFLVVAGTVQAWGLPVSFLAAVAAALVAVSAADRLARRRKQEP